MVSFGSSAPGVAASWTFVLLCLFFRNGLLCGRDFDPFWFFFVWWPALSGFLSCTPPFFAKSLWPLPFSRCCQPTLLCEGFSRAAEGALFVQTCCRIWRTQMFDSYLALSCSPCSGWLVVLAFLVTFMRALVMIALVLCASCSTEFGFFFALTPCDVCTSVRSVCLGNLGAVLRFLGVLPC